MEDIVSPEVKPNPLGLELTQKITAMMYHPKSDTSEELLEEFFVQEGVEGGEQLICQGTSFLSAYFNPDSEAVVYLQMPEPGTTKLPDYEDSRWFVVIKFPFGFMGGDKVVKKYELRVDEKTFDVDFSEETLFYRDGKQIADQTKERLRDVFKKDAVLGYSALKHYIDEVKQLNYRQYNNTYHVQIMEMLNEFAPEHEVPRYNPADGNGLLY